MPRANTQKELLEFGETEFKKLNTLLEGLTPEEMENLELFEERSIKDVLAHLDDWLKLLFSWEDEAKTGSKPAIPGQGYSWKDIPAFNEMLYQASKSRDLAEIRQSLAANHARAMQRVAAHSAEDLETKGRFAWTGSTSVASYYASASSSHYLWASTLIKKRLKSLK